MKINDTHIDFYNQDEEYIKAQLISYYKSFLNNLTTRLLKDGISASNKNLHELHKEKFGMFSMQEKNRKDFTLQQLIESLTKVDEYWNKKVGLTFMP